MGAIKSKFRRSRSASRKTKNPPKKKANLPESQSARKTVDHRLPFSNYRQIFSIRNAWKAIMRTMEATSKDHLIRFFNAYPHHREGEAFKDIKDLTDEDEMHASERFEEIAVEIFQLFDDVIANLESVDVALDEIRRAAGTSALTTDMIKDMETSFLETLKITLGSERFTESTEENFTLLYQFVKTELEAQR